ncbi:MAG: hypothetical protein HZA90_02715 [Verrucomicrobia bacterium]|nr:hypothetical protein [Verrucomicrobiota bacterium]
MKKNFLVLLVSFAALAGLAQYNLDWHTIDGGGGISTGGVFTVSGTIGQPDAGRMAGGNITLEGGFWVPFAVVQTPQAPMLSIRLVSLMRAVVSWPVTAQGFTLLETTNVFSGTWTTNSTTVIDTTSEHTVTVDATAQRRFFRLSR